MKLNAYQVLAVLGSTILLSSGVVRYMHSGSPKELIISVMYFIANICVFCF
ncbi:MAG: hypothetical protein WC890_00750 [Candidatus Margulisiibacteriota bacterium]